MTQEYQLNESQLKKLLDAGKSTPCIMVGGYVPATPQENTNRAWGELGKELGFQPMTVKPVPGKPMKFFTAQPVEYDAADTYDTEHHTGGLNPT